MGTDQPTERSLRQENYAGQSYHLNQGMKKNLADWCLPLDYFVERMLQVGLCQNMRSMKDVLGLLCEFDNAGFQAAGPGERPEDRDRFQLINGHNEEAEDFLRKSLRGPQALGCDRISLS
jgi:hypothetical protein